MLPSTMERKLESKEIEYTLVTDIDEIGDSDLVYEIRKESSEDQIRITILDICKELYEIIIILMLFMKPMVILLQKIR